MTRRGAMKAWHYARQLIVSVCLSLTCATGLYALAYVTGNYLFFGNVAEVGLDRRMALYINNVPPRNSAHPIVLVDFDDETMRRLDHPALISHSSIAQILSRLRGANPHLVIVDIDVTWVWNAAESSELSEVLKQYDASNIPIFLAREALLSGISAQLSVFRPTPFDPLVDASNNLRWVSVESSPSGDGLIRRLTPWTSGCVGGHPLVLPSVALASLLYERDGTVGASTSVFNRAMTKWEPNCTAPFLEHGQPNEVHFPSNAGDLTVERENGARIHYTLSWPPPAPSVDYLVKRPKGLPQPQVLVLPAWPLLKQDAKVSWEPFSDAVVVIGASAADRRDLRVTPVGEMPGAYIAINAVRAWLEFGPEHGSGFFPGLWLVLLLTGLTTIFVLALLFLFPARWHATTNLVLPPILVGALWLVFLFFGDASLATGLLMLQYLVALFVGYAHSTVTKVHSRL